jgi:CRISPR-associated protein Cas2
MLVIVCYDVNTETKAGRRRLRRVARVCESIGQRVQKSVFECQVDLMKLEGLERRLLAEIEMAEDNLRLYRLADGRGCEVREHGHFRATDFEAPLVL